MTDFSEYKYHIEASKKHQGYVVFTIRMMTGDSIELREYLNNISGRTTNPDRTLKVTTRELEGWCEETGEWWDNFCLKSDKELLAFKLRYK